MSLISGSHCGCGEGAIGLLVGSVAAAVTIVGADGGMPRSHLLVTGLGLALCGAVLGKLIGIARAAR